MKFFIGMKSVTLILADQLFDTNHLIECDAFVMIESQEEARRMPYHKGKLVYLFASMREHRDYLRGHGKTVHYYPLETTTSFAEVFRTISETFSTLIYLPVNDSWFEENLEISTSCFSRVQLHHEENQSFLTQKEEFRSWLKANGTGKLKMANFYQWQRARLGILIQKNGKPEGGAWSFDAENRKKIPRNVLMPERTWSWESKYFIQTQEVVESLFKDNPGEMLEHSWIPLTHEQAKKHLHDFVNNSLQDFGPYEDAMTSRDPYVFHSALSPLLNNGLLTPEKVVEAVITAWNTKKVTHLPSVEGFIRQIIGWREWVKGLYDHVYTKPYSSYNYLNNTKKLLEYFYYPQKAPKEIQENIPLIVTLKTVSRLSWCHHIERLMVLANWMVLNRYDPMECYEWFVSQFVDGSEWVMVANVFGMGLFADGGIYATKPYISGGNYLKKMSDYANKDTWEHVWTDLYWKFIKENKHLFLNNPRMAMIIKKKFD